VPEEGFELRLLPVVPLPRRISTGLIKFPLALLKSISKTIGIIKDNNIQLVIATGGYVAGPAILAAWLCRCPLILCEQNSYPGLTTRLGSLFAKVVCLGFEQATNKLWRKSRAVTVGNPVNIEEIDNSKTELRKELGFDANWPLIFITGGSQGAAKINQAVFDMVEKNMLPRDVQILWQTGTAKYDEFAKKLNLKSSNVKIVPFIREMGKAYKACDLIVARCGALTLSEISAFGLPSLLIPYPYAAADHQRKNAKLFEKEGAAVIIQDKQLDGKTLYRNTIELLGNIKKREDMATNSRKLGKQKALSEIADIVETFFDDEGK